MTRRTLPLLLLVLCTPALFAAADREASRPAIIIPVAGTVPGAYGTHFQTDLTLANMTSGPGSVLVDVFWLPREAAGSGTPVTRLVLRPGSIELHEDFVTRVLNRTGVGSILLRTVHEDGTPNLAGRIDAFARIWTPLPGGAGTTSQSVHASTLYSPPVDDLQPIHGKVYGLRQDARFRSNYGIVNMGTKALTFTVYFVTGSDGTITPQTPSERVVVEARSMTHRAVPAGVTGPLTISVRPHQELGIANPTAPIQPWTAYGSSVDNTTGDGWYSKAQAAYPHND